MTRRTYLASVAAASLTRPSPSAILLDPFSLDRIHEVHLKLPPGDWAQLRATYLENTWYNCQFTFDGVTANAAIRSRGNGSRDGVKPGLKVSFRRPGGEPFLDLDTLVLGNHKQDGSGLKDGLSYELFRRMGIPAPRLSYARVTVNGEYWGLYSVVEDLDTAFLKKTHGRADGYLYEYTWADEWDFAERGADAAAYVPSPFEPKTNTKAPEAGTVQALCRTINRAPDGDFSRSLEECLDVRQFLRFIAAETYTDDRDSILGDWGMNNVYFHRLPNDSRFTLIAWDKNWSFFDWRQPILMNANRNVLMRRLLARAPWRAVLRQELERVIEIAGSTGGWLEQETIRRGGLIYAASVADPRRLTGMGRIEDGLPHRIEFAQRRGEYVRSQVQTSL
jgi:spore coat protein CotH